MDRPSRKTNSARSPYLQADSASPPPSASAGPSPRSPASAGSVLKSGSWQQPSSSKAHSQLHPRHHQRRNAGRDSHDVSLSPPRSSDAAHAASSMSSRKRTRTGDSTNSTRFPDSTSPEATAADLEDGPQKGGHSLRRRARVSYATEQIDDEVVVPNSTSSSASRSRKRQALEDEDSYGPRSKRRTASHGDTPTSSTRRNPARRNTGNRRYHDASDPDDFSPLAEDDQQWDDQAVDTWQSPQSSPSSRVNRTATSYSSSTAVGQPGFQDHSNGDGLQDQNLFTSPVAVEAGTVSAGDSANAYGHQSQNEDYYNPDEQLQYESDNQIQNSNMVDYPDFNPEMDETLAPGTESMPAAAAAAAQDRDPSLYQSHQAMLPEDSSSQDGPIASQATFDEAQVEATPPVDPQLMALMDPGLSRTREPTPAKKAKASTPSLPVMGDDEPRELTPSEADAAEDQQDGSDPIKEPSATGASTPTRTTPGIATDFNKPSEVTPEPADPTKESSLRETLHDEQPAESDKSTRSLDPRWCRPQPTPTGRWSNLTPYINGEYTVYPERKPRPEDDDAASEAPSAADKDSDEKDSGKEGEADENGDSQEAATEFPTRAINTPARGSPVAEVPDLAAINSPMPPGEEPEDRDSSQEPTEKPKHYRFRKLNDAEEYVNALQDYDNMNTADLYNLLQTIHSSLETWEEEWVEHGKTVDDYENAQRRRTADTKYENRTRNLDQKGISWEEPEFVVKGYKAKDKRMTDTKYLQAQDRTMAAAYGFEYDPHPSKIGKQNPDTQQAGVTTRGRSLRNQPRQTAKATETEGVVGKRQRKAPQAFEPSTQDVSRASSPVPTGRGGRRRRNANAEVEDVAPEPVDNDADGDVEETGPGRRRRGRGKAAAHRILETFAPEEPKTEEPTRSSGRRGRPRASIRYKEDAPTQENGDKEATPQRPRRVVTLKLPKGATVTPNGPSPPHRTTSRPSTAESDASAHTVESNYSFRPNRQKRFRDGPDDGDIDTLAPARKRARKDVASAEKNKDLVMMDRPIATVEGAATIIQSSREHNHGKQKPRAKGLSGPASANGNTPAPTPPPHGPAASASDEFSRNGTPSSQVTAGDDGRDYRTMTKSEKMSASMKNRWKNGNMAGAVEKRKATLAAKKAAQAANESRMGGTLAPKQMPKVRVSKKDAQLLPGENAAFPHVQPPPAPHMAQNNHPHQVIQSMPSLSQQQMPHHSHQLPQHAHQQHVHHQSPHPYGHHEHSQYASQPQHQYGQPLPPPPPPHHGHRIPPPHHHQQPPPPHPHQQLPPPHQHKQQHPPPHHQPYHRQYPPHEYAGTGHPFPPPGQG